MNFHVNFGRGERLRIRVKGPQSQPMESFWFTVDDTMTLNEVALRFAQPLQPGMLIEIASGKLKWTYRVEEFAGQPSVTRVRGDYMRESDDDRQELDTMRRVIDEELYEWAEYHFGQKPGYLSPIAGDAGVDLSQVNRLLAGMKKAEHKNEATVDRLHHQLAELVDEMREQVKNASNEQIEKYTRARERWVEG